MAEKIGEPRLSKANKLLFSELRAKNRAMENFSSIRNSEGLLAESQAQCLFYWSQYCQELYRGQKSNNNVNYFPIHDESLDSSIDIEEFQAAIRSLKPNKAPGKDRITNEDIKFTHGGT